MRRTASPSSAAILQALRDGGCNLLETTDDSEYGKFGWVMDPEGNKVELWQPPPGSELHTRMPPLLPSA
jgi:hypothetical protein